MNGEARGLKANLPPTIVAESKKKKNRINFWKSISHNVTKFSNVSILALQIEQCHDINSKVKNFMPGMSETF